MRKEIKDRKRKHKRDKRDKRDKHDKLAKQRDQQHDKRGKRPRGQDGSSSRSRKRQREQLEQLVDPSASEIDTLQDRAKMLERDRLFLREDPRAAQPSTALTDDGASSVSSLFLDTKGDFDTLAFGCQFAAHLPKYRVLAAPREDRYARYFGPGFGRGRGGGGRGGGGTGPIITAEALRRMQPHVPVGNEALAELLPLLPEPLAAESWGSGDASAGAARLLMDDEFGHASAHHGAATPSPQMSLGGYASSTPRFVNDLKMKTPGSRSRGRSTARSAAAAAAAAAAAGAAAGAVMRSLRPPRAARRSHPQGARPTRRPTLTAGMRPPQLSGR